MSGSSRDLVDATRRLARLPLRCVAALAADTLEEVAEAGSFSWPPSRSPSQAGRMIPSGRRAQPLESAARHAVG